MNCYKFEENISRFIENELKQDYRRLFLDHKSSCDQCCQKIENVNNNLINFTQLSNIKTSDNFMNGLDQKIYNYNNNPSILNKILGFKLFEIPPTYVLGYVSALILGVFSAYSLFKIDKTNYNELNRNVASTLSNKPIDNSLSEIINEDYGIGETQLADLNDNQLLDKFSKTILKEPENKKKLRKKTVDHAITTVSNTNKNDRQSDIENRMRVSNSSRSMLESNNNISTVSKFQGYDTKEDYIIEYEKKNNFFQKRKDSLLNLLNSNTNKRNYQIIEQIKKDSLEQLEYYQNFDKIMSE